MPIPDILRNINLFVDGRGYVGKIDELTPPKLTIKTEEHRAGGMDVPVEIDMGMEKLECDFTLAGTDAGTLKSWGLGSSEPVPLTFRGAVQDGDGVVRAVVMRMRGIIREADFGTWKPGEKAPLKVMVALRYYKLEIDGEVIYEIDAENMIRIVDGEDRLEAPARGAGDLDA